MSHQLNTDRILNGRKMEMVKSKWKIFMRDVLDDGEIVKCCGQVLT